MLCTLLQLLLLLLRRLSAASEQDDTLPLNGTALTIDANDTVPVLYVNSNTLEHCDQVKISVN